MTTLGKWIRKKRLENLFLTIYKRNKWGGNHGNYFSGAGSRGEYASIYSRYVRKFIEQHNIRSVVDLGCGDFFVGKLICENTPTVYIGVDIVRELVIRNQHEFGGPFISFQWKDITSDVLPDGDLCLIRQVLQHLSNKEVFNILGKLKKYHYILVTEHYPSPLVNVIPNKDMVHSHTTRIDNQSAIYLELPPFNQTNVLEVFSINVLEKHTIMKVGETLKTFVMENLPNDITKIA